MKKLMILIGVLTAFLIVSSFNMAYAGHNEGCPPNNPNCNFNDDDSPGSVTNNNTNEGVQQQVKIKDIDVTTIIDFNHITPDIGRTSAEMIDGDANTVKTAGISNWITIVALSHAKRMSRDTTDYEVLDSVMIENDFRTNLLRKGNSGILMGAVTFSPTGPKVTIDGLFGRAMIHGMGIGATHFQIFKHDGIYHQGSKAGIDFGGAASAVAKSDGSAVIAPGATLGYSTAWSANEWRSGLVAVFYFDPASAVKPIWDKGLEYHSTDR